MLYENHVSKIGFPVSSEYIHGKVNTKGNHTMHCLKTKKSISHSNVDIGYKTKLVNTFLTIEEDSYILTF